MGLKEKLIYAAEFTAMWTIIVLFLCFWVPAFLMGYALWSVGKIGRMVLWKIGVGVR